MAGNTVARSARSAAGVVGKLLVKGIGAAAHVVLPAVGGTPDQSEMQRSVRFSSGRFGNLPQQPRPPVSEDRPFTVREFLRSGGDRHPTRPIPLVRPRPDSPQDGLHLTWYGHASSLVEIEGRRFLLDPVWGRRASPVSFIGP